jgi:predicted AAA+ superfamily ATPase
MTKIKRKKAKPSLAKLFIAQGRMMRFLEIIALLHNARWKVTDLAKRFDLSERTIYRYFDIMETLDIAIEKDFNDNWFLAQDNCPLCGQEVKHG